MRIKSNGQRAFSLTSNTCNDSPFLTPHLPTAQAHLTSPFGQQCIAWVNGTHWFAPIKPPVIRKRQPRTEHIDLRAAYIDATQGW